jgi:RNA polymerase sigma-70 factor (ECF subfamily)
LSNLPRATAGRTAPQKDEKIRMSQFHRDLEALIPKLRQYAYALTHDRERRDDLVQACLLRALEKQSLWQPGTDLRAWLFTLMHHHFISEVRRSVRSPVVSVPFLAEWQHAAAPTSPDGRLTLRDFARALDRLPFDQRAALLLVGLEGLTYEEVADILRVPVGTVKSRLWRARSTIRRALEGADAAAAAIPAAA